MNKIEILIFVFILLFLSCITIKPLYQSGNGYECEYFEDTMATISECAKNVKRYNPEISKSMYLIPNYGSPNKTLKVFKYRNNNRLEYLFLFHFADRFNYELTIDSLHIKGEKAEIKKKIYDDASVILSNAQDLIFYVIVYEDEYHKILNSKNIVIKIHDMELHIDPDCKNLILL